MIDRINQYEIYPYQLDSLQVTSVTTHDESCWAIIDQLVSFGISLNQIKLLYNPDAEYANLWIQADARTVTVQWAKKGSSEFLIQDAQTVANLLDLVKRLVS